MRVSSQEKQREGNQAKTEPFVKDLLSNCYLPFIVNTVAELGFFEVLEKQPLTAKDVSTNLRTKERVTEACLEVLKTAKLLNFSNGKFGLTTNATKYLLKSSGQNQLEQLKDNNITVSRPMAELKAALLGNNSKSEASTSPTGSTKTSPWQNKENLIAIKNRMKSGQIEAVTSFMESLPEFSTCRKMMDCAGSIGYYSFGILEKNPNLTAHVYDLPQVCSIALEVQKDEKDFNRVSFHGFDLQKNESIGEGYDLFFVSNALYGQRSKEQLVAFFKRANKAMVMGGVLVSNHWTTLDTKEGSMGVVISDLLSSFSGRPVHSINEDLLKEALIEAGFDGFTAKLSDSTAAKPVLLLAARKVRGV